MTSLRAVAYVPAENPSSADHENGDEVEESSLEAGGGFDGGDCGWIGGLGRVEEGNDGGEMAG